MIVEKELDDLRDRLDLIRTLQDPLQPTERRRHNLTQIQVGGFIRFQNDVWKVVNIARYEETKGNFRNKTGYVAHELTIQNTRTLEMRFLEWEIDEDDGLQICLTTSQIGMRQLCDDARSALDIDDIEKIVDDEDGNEAVILAGISYYYGDDWETRYSRGNNGRGKGECAWIYEFCDESERRFLTFEVWKTGPKDDDVEVQIFTSAPIRPAELEIIALGGESRGEQP